MSLRQKIEQNKQHPQFPAKQLSSSFQFQQNIDPQGVIVQNQIQPQQQQPILNFIQPAIQQIDQPQLVYTYSPSQQQPQFVGQPIFYQPVPALNNINNQILRPQSSQIFPKQISQQNLGYSPTSFLKKQNQEIPQQIQQIQNKIEETSSLVNAIQQQKKIQILEDTETQLNIESLTRENQMLHKHLQERLDDILVWKNNYEKLQKQFKEMNQHWESAQKQILDVQQAAQKQIIDNQKKNFIKEMKSLKDKVADLEQKMSIEKNEKQNVIMEFTEYKRQFNVETQSMNSLIERINQYDSAFRQSEINYSQYKEKMEQIERINKRKIDELQEKVNELTEQKKYYFEKFEEKFQKKKQKIQHFKRQFAAMTLDLQQKDQQLQFQQTLHQIHHKPEVPIIISEPQQQFTPPSHPVYDYQNPISHIIQPPQMSNISFPPTLSQQYDPYMQGTRTQMYDKFIQEQTYNSKKPFLYEYQKSGSPQNNKNIQGQFGFAGNKYC